MGVLPDRVGELAHRVRPCRPIGASLPIAEDPEAVPDHAGHRAATCQEVAVAERVAGDNAVRRDTRIVSNALDQAEQLRPVDHLDLFELVARNVEDIRSLLDVVLVEQVLQGAVELGCVARGSRWDEALFDRIEGLEIGHLDQDQPASGSFSCPIAICRTQYSWPSSSNAEEMRLRKRPPTRTSTSPARKSACATTGPRPSR